MNDTAIRAAAAALVAARREGRPLSALPAEARPASFEEAARIQDLTLALLEDRAVGYKVAGIEPEAVMWAPILASRRFLSPARLAASTVPLLGIEVEIAFRLDRDVEADDVSWTLDRFDGAVTALPLIEIVDTRFTSYTQTPLLDRAADLMSNGAVVCGKPYAEWRSVDLATLPVTLAFDGREVAGGRGGHAAGDPRRPALAFLAAASRARPLPRGTVITTGTYTGLLYAEPGNRITADVGPFGTVVIETT